MRRLSKLISNIHIWAVVFLFGVAIILHYPQQILHIEGTSVFSFLGVTRHSFERVLLLLPVAYLGFFFSLRTGLAGIAVSLVIMLPRVFLLSPSPPDALFESLSATVVAVMLIMSFHMQRMLARRPRNIQELLTKITDSSPIPTFAIDKRHKVTHWNAAIELLADIRKDEMIGTDEQWRAFYLARRPVMADLIVDEAPPDEIEMRYPSKQRKSRLIQGAYEAEDFFPDMGNGGKWLRFTAAPITNSDGKIVGAIETLQDITEQKSAEDNIGYYIREITRAQEEERKRIACELHDETAQELVALSRKLEGLDYSHQPGPQPGVSVEEIRHQIDKILDGVRRFSQDLRPSVLDDLGLVPALEWLTADFSIHFSISIGMSLVGPVRRLPPEVELLLFRIAQEALRNVCKHSGASEGRVTLEFGEDKIILNVKDNGKGFEPPKSIGNLASIGKLGLAGMQQRANLIGAHFSLKTGLGKGTTITVEVLG